MLEATTEQAVTAEGKKMVAFVMETQTSWDGQYRVLLAVEGETGYHLTDWLWGKDFEVADRLCAERNARMGYDRKEAMRIVLGTMRNAPLESICLGDFRKLHRQGRACLHVGTGQPMADIHGSGIVDVRLEDAEYLKGYVNVYRISREFGGHEEGGWWYDWYEFETCIHCLLTEMDEVALFLERFYGDPPGNPPLHSVLSNGEWCIYKELDKAESQSKSRPHYE